jgi:hypothetical protein
VTKDHRSQGLDKNKSGYKAVALAGKTRLHRYGIERFLLEVADKIKPQALLLDGGAGNCKHKKMFPDACVISLVPYACFLS